MAVKFLTTLLGLLGRARNHLKGCDSFNFDPWISLTFQIETHIGNDNPREWKLRLNIVSFSFNGINDQI